MIKELIINELNKYKDDIKSINENKDIDCITIFFISDEDYDI